MGSRRTFAFSLFPPSDSNNFVSCLSKEHVALESLAARVNVQLFCKKFPSQRTKEKIELARGHADRPLMILTPATPTTEEWLEKLGNQLYQDAS